METHPATANTRRYAAFWSHELGSVPLAEIDSASIRKILVKALGTPPAIPEKERTITRKSPVPRVWEPATLNRYSAYLRKVLQAACYHKNKLLTSNPALKQTPQRDGITFHHEAEVSMFLSREQALSLKTQLSPEDWPLVGFALETGMRRHEQFSMKWSQVNFDTGFVTLPLLKSGKTTQIALSDYAIEILKSLDSF